jgi:hypothetical protein
MLRRSRRAYPSDTDNCSASHRVAMADEINGADAAVLTACDEMPGLQVRTSRPDIVLFRRRPRVGVTTRDLIPESTLA